jgi:hypothetical protein
MMGHRDTKAQRFIILADSVSLCLCGKFFKCRKDYKNLSPRPESLHGGTLKN